MKWLTATSRAQSDHIGGRQVIAVATTRARRRGHLKFETEIAPLISHYCIAATQSLGIAASTALYARFSSAIRLCAPAPTKSGCDSLIPL